MKETVVEVKSQVLTTITTLMTTVFGLIASLAWNEAIKALYCNFSQKVME